MPIYEYLCEQCNYIMERLEKMTNDNKNKTCPKCKSDKFKKIMSASNFSLKGKGWYKTDYKKISEEI